MTTARTITEFIKAQAEQLGFSGCGMSRAEPLHSDALRLESWLKHSRHGSMSYMENHRDLRVDPTKLSTGAESVVSFLFNYYTESRQQDKSAPRVSIYAFGRDYHAVIRKRLKRLLRTLQEKYPDIEGRICVDTAPILERSWAVRAGLGWIGKNCCLINRHSGSYHFLAELILNVPLDYDEPETDRCADCTLCIEACPAGAIIEPRVVDARRCISYLTIEHRGRFSADEEVDFRGWAFGCDICQQVCPWNRKASEHAESELALRPELARLSRAQWGSLTESQYRGLFAGSAIKRARYEDLMRNVVSCRTENEHE
jgi:epoxyqueuosine reductase